MIGSIEKNKCTGCQMCADICPVNAIEYKTDSEGFWYPKVNEDKCIKCGKCIKECPSLNENNMEKDSPKVYKTWIKDTEIRLNSTSGGIFYAIAQHFIKNDGYVVGCIYGEDYKSAKHIIGHTMEELKQIMGSKYFQSDMCGIYKKVKELLEQGKQVLFVGAPCQSAALQKFLNKEYENLLTMDFICRGINSPKAFRKYVEELEEKNKSKVTYVQLKNKKTGWTSLASYFKFENGSEHHADRNKDPWIKGYIEGNLYMRKSCPECMYKTLPRISDISVGDFWGIKNQSKEDMFKGISVILVNSDKGMKCIEDIKENIEIEERELEEAIKGNPCILENAKEGKNHSKFFELIDNMKFSNVVNKCINKSLVRRVLSKIKRKLRQIKFLIKNIDIIKFIKLNFFSRQIIRDKKCYFMPYKNAKIQLAKTSKIYIHNSNIHFGTNKIKGSRAETYLRMSPNAKWVSNNGSDICYNVTIEVKENAELNTRYFSANSGSVIICAKKITIGEDVMLGRNIVIYDSDYHQLLDENYNMKNPPQEVVIEEHVWLTSNINVLKGTTIGRNSIISSQCVVRKDIEENSIAGGNSTATKLSKAKIWSRQSNNEVKK